MSSRPTLLTAQPTTTLTYDNTVYEISRMAPEIQQMVAYFDAWRQEELDLQSKLLSVRGALEHLKSQLVTAIQKQVEEAAASPTENVSEAVAEPVVPATRRKRK